MCVCVCTKTTVVCKSCCTFCSDGIYSVCVCACACLHSVHVCFSHAVRTCVLHLYKILMIMTFKINEVNSSY